MANKAIVITTHTMHKNHLLILVCIFLWSSNSFSQVTMGSKNNPSKGSILDIKTQESSITSTSEVTDDKNITSDKGGIILPRVKLQNMMTLEPFIKNNDSNLEKEKIKHAGLMVYNINDSYLTATDPKKVFKQGIYMWDGSRWSMLVREEFKFFHMPTFNLDTSETGTFTIDLYDMYTSNFARKGTNAATYPAIVKNPTAKRQAVPTFERNELNYYITHHDASIIEIVKLEDNGKLTYKVDPKPPFNTFSYMNIVLVVK